MRTKDYIKATNWSDYVHYMHEKYNCDLFDFKKYYVKYEGLIRPKTIYEVLKFGAIKFPNMEAFEAFKAELFKMGAIRIIVPKTLIFNNNKDTELSEIHIAYVTKAMRKNLRDYLNKTGREWIF